MIDVESYLLRLPQNLPRYTSYPHATHFGVLTDPSIPAALLEACRRAETLSVYIHIPLCDRLCWFCGCHTKQTLSCEPITAYVKALVREIEDFGQRLGIHKRISKIHLGGGSPSLLKEKELSKTEMAVRMKTSRAAVDRLLDASNSSVTLNTLGKAARALGRKIKIELVPA